MAQAVRKLSIPSITEPRPFIKWVGGKRQLFPEITRRFPKSFNNYFEPFIGGGAVFFNFIENKATIGDINEELINTYLVIKSNVDSLIDLLKNYKIKHSRELFYKIRALNPSKLSDCERAARLIYLNKTCFNGLYRVNKKGEFNVPLGLYKNPLICDEDNLWAVNCKLKQTKIICGDYKELTKKAKPNDFVYFDPPYEPISRSSNFVNYSKDGFTQDDQRELASLFVSLTEKGVNCMLSNSSAPLIIKLYKGFNLHKVKALRSVNSNAAGRGKIDELLITNY